MLQLGDLLDAIEEKLEGAQAGKRVGRLSCQRKVLFNKLYYAAAAGDRTTPLDSIPDLCEGAAVHVLLDFPDDIEWDADGRGVSYGSTVLKCGRAAQDQFKVSVRVAATLWPRWTDSLQYRSSAVVARKACATCCVSCQSSWAGPLFPSAELERVHCRSQSPAFPAIVTWNCASEATNLLVTLSQKP